MRKPEDRGPVLEIHSPGIHGNGSSTKVLYKVEYRNTTSMVKVLGDGQVPFPFVIDHYWRTLQIQVDGQPYAANIPIRAWDAQAASHGLVSYVAAEAHRWTFLAALEAGVGGAGGALCVETRLVEVELQEQYSTKEKGVTAPMSLGYKPDGVEPRHPKLPAQNVPSDREKAQTP